MDYSLYIHVPFCASLCRYCDFYSVRYDPEVAARYVEAVIAEWRLRRAGQECAPRTVYIGGGTPSVLDDRLFERLVRETAGPAGPVEFTVECNPGSATPRKLRSWAACGVNRVSVGVQSLVDRELRLLGRTHDAAAALALLDDPALAGFASVGADLMYGLPGQTIESLGRSLDGVLSRPHVSHLSAYELTIAPGTPFGRHAGMLPLPSEDLVVEMAALVVEQCRKHGLERYEISNFARPGRECRHNRTYWRHEPYIGLGAAAHSYLPPVRQANVDDVCEYMRLVEEGKSPAAFRETVDREMLGREMIMLGLRTVEGVDETAFEERTGKVFTSPGRLPLLRRMVDDGLVHHADRRWRLTDRGMLVADAVIRDLA